MKSLLLVACLWNLGGGEREQGLELYRAGKFAEAAAAFRAAIEQDGDAPDLQWNLALACWRSGDLAAAETAAEKYAALAKDARVDLHRGLLGAVRFAEAQQLETEADAMAAGAPGAPPAAAGQPPAPPPDPLPVLERALEKAQQAKSHFVTGAAANATPELLRNTERALRYVEQLQKKIDDWKQQREQEKDDPQGEDQKQQDDSQKEEQQDGEKQDGEEQDGEKQAKPDPQGEQPKDGSEGQDGDQTQSDGPPPDPTDEDRAKPADPNDGDDQSQPGQEPPPPPTHDQSRPGEPKGENRTDAPGECAEGKELTAEQAQRLLEQLKQLDGRLRQLQRGNKTGRRPVGRDW